MVESFMLFDRDHEKWVETCYSVKRVNYDYFKKNQLKKLILVYLPSTNTTVLQLRFAKFAYEVDDGRKFCIELNVCELAGGHSSNTDDR